MTDCFHCGSDDHLSYDCPRHTREKPATRRRLRLTSQPPEPSEQDQLPAYQHIDLTRRDPAETTAIYGEWGPVTREVLALELGRVAVDDGPYVDTEFRRHFKLPRRTETELREMARQQVEEFRAANANVRIDSASDNT